MQLLEILLTEMLDKQASDLHIIAGIPPVFRVNTELLQSDFEPLTPEQTLEAVESMVGPERTKSLMTRRDLDFSTALKDRARFRVNAHFQRDSIALAFRLITSSVPPLSELSLPPIVQKLIDMPRGLVLVTGVTGSGKSTTLAAMVDQINKQRNEHIITLEDPIEYLIPSDKSVIEQRELGSDVPTFASGLKHALRQDPDVILVGEMRDLETTSAAITAAETGHLVLSTLHTQNASQTVERIIDIYPSGQQNQIRAMLSNTLQAVISQTLFKRVDISGMIPACEIMMCTPAVRNCIRENRIHEIPNIISTSKSAGMCSMDDAIKALYLNEQISYQQAIAMSSKPELFTESLTVFRG